MGLEQMEYTEKKLSPKLFEEKSCYQGTKKVPHKKLFPNCKNVTKQSEYKNFNLLIIVKIGTCNDTNSQNVRNIFGSNVDMLELWRTDPTQFTFKPTFVSVMPLFNEEEKMLVGDGKHTPKIMNYDQS